jgi:predicted Zn-dependent protease
MAYALQQRTDDAVALYQSLLGAHPENDGVLLFLGVTLADTGQMREALSIFKKAVEVAPENITGRVLLARCLGDTGDTDACIRLLEEAENNIAEDAVDWVMIGQDYLALGYFNRALRVFQRAMDVAPDCAPARDGMRDARSVLDESC